MSTTPDGKIVCEICGSGVHSIELHLEKVHPGWGDLARYEREFPGKPIFSEIAKQKLAEQKAAKEAAAATPAPSAPLRANLAAPPMSSTKKALHEVFGLPETTVGVKNNRGQPIPVTVYGKGDWQNMVPEVDPNYVFDVGTLKDGLMALELNLPWLSYGHAGTGKTTLVEQICARTNRPLLRIQHTINTEESHIVGQWTLRGGQTHFELGPLAMAMRYGWVYLADEYDFALPSVVGVYQPILERSAAGKGKSLVIKDADIANRVIQPHDAFRFVATGNSNGSGDEHGLYQGVQIQNAANYDRFNICTRIEYMAPELEQKVIEGQAAVAAAEAQRFVEFGTAVRKAFDAKQISHTVSPRTLIAAAMIGKRRNSARIGLTLAFINKLSSVDREAVDSVAKRIFGD